MHDNTIQLSTIGTDTNKSNKMREHPKLRPYSVDCRGATCFSAMDQERASKRENSWCPARSCSFSSSRPEVLWGVLLLPSVWESKCPKKGSPQNQNIHSLFPTALRGVLMWNTNNKNHKVTTLWKHALHACVWYIVWQNQSVLSPGPITCKTYMAA